MKLGVAEGDRDCAAVPLRGGLLTCCRKKHTQEPASIRGTATRRPKHSVLSCRLLRVLWGNLLRAKGCAAPCQRQHNGANFSQSD